MYVLEITQLVLNAAFFLKQLLLLVAVSSFQVACQTAGKKVKFKGEPVVEIQQQIYKYLLYILYFFDIQ